MSIRGLLFQWASTINIQRACWSSTKRHYLIEHLLVAELALNNNHSLTHSIFYGAMLKRKQINKSHNLDRHIWIENED
jgi:hypothetical protein